MNIFLSINNYLPCFSHLTHRNEKCRNDESISIEMLNHQGQIFLCHWGSLKVFAILIILFIWAVINQTGVLQGLFHLLDLTIEFSVLAQDMNPLNIQ